MKAKTAPRDASSRARQAKAHVAAPPAERSYDRWYVAAIAAGVVLLYWRALSGPFVFDDGDLLEVHSAVRNKNLWIIFTGPRPLLIASFALNHWLTGSNPFYFHLVSLALHALNTVIVWRILRHVCASPGLGNWLTPEVRGVVATFTPLLYLASPVQTESVGYISSRSELLAATFYLLAMLVFVSGWRQKRQWTVAVLVGVLYGCAVTSKQHAITLPAALLLADYFFLAGRDWRRLRENWRVYLLLGGEMIAGGFLVLRQVMNAPSAGFSLGEITWKDYLFTQFRMYWLYLKLLAAPVGLNADYDIQPSRTLFERASWLALLGIVALAGAAIWLRQRLALACFGVLFFFVTLAPTSGFFPLLDYAAERRLYLPALGFLLAALALACQWRPSPRPLRWALVGILLLYGGLTFERNRVWQDSLALWEDAVEKSPGKWRAHNNLGFEYAQRGRFAEASREFERAEELVRPKRTRQHAEVLSSLGSTYANRRMYVEAIRAYQSALEFEPYVATLWTNLAIAELRLGRAEGWEHFEQATRVDDLAWEPRLARGNFYFELRRYDEAIQDYRRVLQLNPDNAAARNNLAAAEAMQRRRGN